MAASVSLPPALQNCCPFSKYQNPQLLRSCQSPSLLPFLTPFQSKKFNHSALRFSVSAISATPSTDSGTQFSSAKDSRSFRVSLDGVNSSKETSKAGETKRGPAGIDTRRREALIGGAVLLAALASEGICPESAEALGSSFLKDRLKESKKATFQNLLYPIEASRVQLEKVHAILATCLRDSADLPAHKIKSRFRVLFAGDIDSSSLTPTQFAEAKELVQVSSRDCMPLEHYAGTQILASRFFEVCTFKLLVKNAVSLLDKTDPKRVQAQQALVDLNRAFSELDDVLAENLLETSSQGKERILPIVVSTQKALDELEDGIRDALGAPPRVA